MTIMIVVRFLSLYPLLSSALQQTSGISSSTTKTDRKAQKAEEKFLHWIEQCKNPSGEDHPLLMVDGNNVRGIGKFKWNPVELQHRVAGFCHEYRIPRAVIVWDHGSCQCASVRRYESFPSSTDGEQFCVDMVILFSGLHQRADDVILAESGCLKTRFFNNKGWGSMAFVTSDRELNYDLRKQSFSQHDMDYASRRRRRVGKMNSDDADSVLDVKMHSDIPLFCDSFQFVELLLRVPPLEWDGNDVVSLKAARAVEVAKESLVRFSKLQRRRSVNPRRESTWERCVLSETFRLSLCESLTSASLSSDCESSSDCYSRTASEFLREYMWDLEESRGYRTPWNIVSTSADEPTVSHGPFQGPARLDKKQRRLLGSYNSFLNEGGKLHKNEQIDGK